MYLSAIIDLRSRYVIHWSLSNNMTAEWCTEVLKAEIENMEIQKSSILIIGSQFTSEYS